MIFYKKNAKITQVLNNGGFAILSVFDPKEKKTLKINTGVCYTNYSVRSVEQQIKLYDFINEFDYTQKDMLPTFFDQIKNADLLALGQEMEIIENKEC